MVVKPPLQTRVFVYKIMESSLPTVLVRPGEADRIIGGHPWIYSGSVLRLTQPAEEGARSLKIGPSDPGVVQKLPDPARSRHDVLMLVEPLLVVPA